MHAFCSLRCSRIISRAAKAPEASLWHAGVRSDLTVAASYADTTRACVTVAASVLNWIAAAD